MGSGDWGRIGRRKGLDDHHHFPVKASSGRSANEVQCGLPLTIQVPSPSLGEAPVQGMSGMAGEHREGTRPTCNEIQPIRMGAFFGGSEGVGQLHRGAAQCMRAQCMKEGFIRAQ